MYLSYVLQEMRLCMVLFHLHLDEITPGSKCEIREKTTLTDFPIAPFSTFDVTFRYYIIFPGACLIVNSLKVLFLTWRDGFSIINNPPQRALGLSLWFYLYNVVVGVGSA